MTTITITRSYTTANGRHGVCYTINGERAATFIPASRVGGDVLGWLRSSLNVTETHMIDTTPTITRDGDVTTTTATRTLIAWNGLAFLADAPAADACEIIAAHIAATEGADRRTRRAAERDLITALGASASILWGVAEQRGLEWLLKDGGEPGRNTPHAVAAAWRHVTGRPEHVSDVADWCDRSLMTYPT